MPIMHSGGAEKVNFKYEGAELTAYVDLEPQQAQEPGHELEVTKARPLGGIEVENSLTGETITVTPAIRAKIIDELRKTGVNVVDTAEEAEKSGFEPMESE